MFKTCQIICFVDILVSVRTVFHRGGIHQRDVSLLDLYFFKYMLFTLSSSFIINTILTQVLKLESSENISNL